jgi:hypothetical protein
MPQVSACIIEDKTGLKQNSLFGTDRKQVLEDVDLFCEKIAAGVAAKVCTPLFLAFYVGCRSLSLCPFHVCVLVVSPVFERITHTHTLTLSLTLTQHSSHACVFVRGATTSW